MSTNQIFDDLQCLLSEHYRQLQVHIQQEFGEWSLEIQDEDGKVLFEFRDEALSGAVCQAVEELTKQSAEVKKALRELTRLMGSDVVSLQFGYTLNGRWPWCCTFWPLSLGTALSSGAKDPIEVIEGAKRKYLAWKEVQPYLEVRRTTLKDLHDRIGDPDQRQAFHDIVSKVLMRGDSEGTAKALQLVDPNFVL